MRQLGRSHALELGGLRKWSKLSMNPLRSRRLTRLLIYGPIVTLPLILGSVTDFLWFYIASVFITGFALLLLASEGGDTATGPSPVLQVIPSRRILFLLSPLVIYPLLQVVPLPLPLISVLSPHRAEWLQRSMDATGWSRWWASLSYSPMDTLASGLLVLTLLLFALLLNRCLRDGTIRPGGLFAVIFLIAGFEALYGILQVLVSLRGLDPGSPPGPS